MTAFQMVRCNKPYDSLDIFFKTRLYKINLCDLYDNKSLVKRDFSYLDDVMLK